MSSRASEHHPDHRESRKVEATHPGHEGPEMSSTETSWRIAASATLHCLTGCAIGEVLGMVLATWWGWSTLPSVILAVALAFVFGYSLTMIPVLRSGVVLRSAIGIALAADSVSIATMEVVDNAFLLAVPGALEATLGDALFWVSLAVSLILAFVVTLPINRALIARGKGHAVAHAYHH